MKSVMCGGLLLVVGLMGAGAETVAPRMSMTGFGQVRIGMTEEALGRVVGKTILPPADQEEAACRYAFPDDLEGVGYLLLHGRLARIDVDAPGVPTLSGVSVGASEAEVVSLYGDGIEVSNHFYLPPPAKYLTLLSTDRKHGIRFETDGTVVTRYYAGTAQAIQFVEGCQ